MVARRSAFGVIGVLGLWLALLLAPLAAPRVARAEPFELVLRFAPEVAPCFSREELIAATRERLVRRAPQLTADPSAPVSVDMTLEIGAVAEGWRAAITSVRRASGERGVRELTVAPECSGLRDALSLVLALMIEEAARTPPVPTPPAAVPPVPAVAPVPTPIKASKPVRPATPPIPRHDPPMRPELALASGVGLGLGPAPLPLISAAARIPLMPARMTILPLFVELDLDLFLPREVAGDGWRVGISGGGAQGQLCGRFTRGPLHVDPCAGLWLQALSVSGAGDFENAFATETFTLAGWDVRAHVGVALGAGWSLFVSGQLMAPFARQRMQLRAAGDEPVTDSPRSDSDDPFFNADTTTVTSLQWFGRLEDADVVVVVHEPVEFSGIVLLGVALAL